MSTRTLGGVLVIGIACCVTSGLGYWQQQRAAQKRAVQCAMQAAESAPPIQLTGPLTDPPTTSSGPPALADVEYRRMIVRGAFCPTRGFTSITGPTAVARDSTS